ncbi:hypothetical protein LJC10_05465, partial [Selenomonadales bacterium OttesenSCG-928-I06]|nr:hypothetical protein [Selenomonadales bacterium OttesenSCG-928-I06]
MKNKYIIAVLTIALLSVILLIYQFFKPPEPSTAHKPDLVVTIDGTEKTKLINIAEDEWFTYYITDLDVARTLISSEYKQNKNWQMNIFLEPKLEELRLEYAKILTTIKPKTTNTKTSSNKKLWALSNNTIYSSQNKTAIVLEEYYYNEKGQIITSRDNQE